MAPSYRYAATAAYNGWCFAIISHFDLLGFFNHTLKCAFCFVHFHSKRPLAHAHTHIQKHHSTPMSKGRSDSVRHQAK